MHKFGFVSGRIFIALIYRSNKSDSMYDLKGANAWASYVLFASQLKILPMDPGRMCLAKIFFANYRLIV